MAGRCRVGDTVELRTGTADSFASGLTLRVGDRTTVLTSSSGDNARPLAVGFSGMEGAGISDFSVTRRELPRIVGLKLGSGRGSHRDCQFQACGPRGAASASTCAPF